MSPSITTIGGVVIILQQLCSARKEIIMFLLITLVSSTLATTKLQQADCYEPFEKIRFQWNIEDFKQLATSGVPRVSSPTFPILGDVKVLWRIKMYPNEEGRMHFFVCAEKYNDDLEFVSIRLDIVDNRYAVARKAMTRRNGKNKVPVPVKVKSLFETLRNAYLQESYCFGDWNLMLLEDMYQYMSESGILSLNAQILRNRKHPCTGRTSRDPEYVSNICNQNMQIITQASSVWNGQYDANTKASNTAKTSTLNIDTEDKQYRFALKYLHEKAMTIGYLIQKKTGDDATVFLSMSEIVTSQEALVAPDSKVVFIENTDSDDGVEGKLFAGDHVDYKQGGNLVFRIPLVLLVVEQTQNCSVAKEGMKFDPEQDDLLDYYLKVKQQEYDFLYEVIANLEADLEVCNKGSTEIEDFLDNEDEEQKSINERLACLNDIIRRESPPILE